VIAGRGTRRGIAAGRFRTGVLAFLIALATALSALPAAATSTTPAKKSAKTRAPVRSPEPSGLRKAPAIEASRWLNTKPLRSADLEGKPRLVEFWTFGCENCKRTVPAVREIQYLYAKRGLVLVGVHTPEFPRERDSTAVAAAAKEWGYTFPIVLDNDSLVWKAFANKYWPALYLIDRHGTIRATHIGELHVKTRAWSNLQASIEEVLAVEEGTEETVRPRRKP